MKRRDWSLVNDKRAAVMGCAVCGRGWPLEAAHIIGRARDSAVKVNPDEVVFLCKRHHLQYDAHDLDLYPFLSLPELAGAVRAASSPGEALRRLSAPLWRRGSHSTILNSRIAELEALRDPV